MRQQNLELSQNDTKELQGLAAMMMVFLHLFCRKDVGGVI